MNNGSISPQHDKIIAAGISLTAKSLWYPEFRELHARILSLLSRPKKPLTPEELTTILDALTSQRGSQLLAELNHRLFRRFLDAQDERNASLAELWTEELSLFAQWGMGRHQRLQELAQFIKDFAKEEARKEPLHITANGIWELIAVKQYLATLSHQRKLFAEACLDDSAQVLKTWNNFEDGKEIPGNISLRYDQENKLLGIWDASNNHIIGKEILSGFTPAPWVEIFYGDEWTLPCTNEDSNQLSLIEFNPDGMGFLDDTPPYFSVIGANNISIRGVIPSQHTAGDIFYAHTHKSRDKRVIHSGPWFTVRTNGELTQVSVGGDKMFVTHDGTLSFSNVVITSLQTGGTMKIPEKDIVWREETEGNILWTLWKRINVAGKINLPGKDPSKWKIWGLFWTKTISVFELQAIWNEAAKRATPRKSHD